MPGASRPPPGTTPASSRPPGVPTAMLFVRNPTGVSHSPDEHAETARLPGRRRGAGRRAGRARHVRRYWLERAWPAPGPSTASLVEVEDGVFTRVEPGTAERSESPCRVDDSRSRQLPQPRLPPGAAGTDAARARDVLDLARADVRRRGAARPGLATTALARAAYREMVSVGYHQRRRVPLPAPRSGRHAVRRPERDGSRARRGRARGRASGSPCSTPATSPPGSAPARRACRSGSATATRGAAGPPARRGRRAPATWCRRAIHSVRAVPRDQLPHVVAWAADAARCTCTCPSRSPRTTRAWRRTACTPTELLAEAGALGPRTSAVHATHLTDVDIALLGGSADDGLLLPDDRARPRRRHRPVATRCTTPGRR